MAEISFYFHISTLWHPINNLIASQKGWGIPIIPTLLGPLRIWIYPKTFRSNKVKKANLTKTQIINNKLPTNDNNNSK